MADKVDPLERLVTGVTEAIKNIAAEITDEDARKRAEEAVAAVLQSGYKITEPEAELEFGYSPDE